MNRKVFLFVGLAVLFVAAGWRFGQTLARAQEAQQIAASAAVGSTFTYQGRLDQAGAPANGSFDFEFGLWDDLSIGSQVGFTLTQTSLAVTDGLFTTSLDFGTSAFSGDQRFLAIAVQLAGGGGYTALTPRQALTAAPYAIYADSSDWSGINSIPTGFADGIDNTSGVEPANIVWVAKSGGDFTSVNAALASISDASIDNTYLIKIAPGVYTETGGIDMKSYVDIEGSGNRTTFLRAVGGTTNPVTDGSSATLRAGNIWAEVRSLHVDSYTSANYAVAIWTTGASNSQLRFTDVVAEAAGGFVENFGIFNKSSAPFFDTFGSTY